MSRRTRRPLTPQEKLAVRRRHLLEKVPLADLCDQYGIQPTLFYNWQKAFFESGATAFEPAAHGRKAGADAKDQKIAALEAKLRTKPAVLAELMEEHVRLKKAPGEP